MKHIRLLSALVLFVAAICPALAADTIFPPGVRVGVTPLVGLVGARTFVGFETEDHGVKVLMAELPAEAYNEVVTAFKASPAGANGSEGARALQPCVERIVLQHMVVNT